VISFVAHRGYSKKYHENTLDAFRAVIDHPRNGTSLIGIECDIHLTSDGQIPVMHNTVVTNREGKLFPIYLIPFERLRQLYAETHAGSSQTVPDIHSVLELIFHRTELCFEIKEGLYDLERFTHQLVKALEW
jgi:glycerophosphoryl diester phosphodiesterase